MGFLSDLASRQTKYERAITACKTGDAAALRSLLKNHKSIDVRPVGFTTVRAPLEDHLVPVATAHGHAECVRLLLDTFPGYEMTVARREAAIDGGLAVYRVYVDRHPRLPTLRLGAMEDPLSAVCTRGDLEFVRFLVEHGADPARSRYFGQPLMDFLAREPKLRRVYDVLLEAGAGRRHNEL